MCRNAPLLNPPMNTPLTLLDMLVDPPHILLCAVEKISMRTMEPTLLRIFQNGYPCTQNETTNGILGP